MTTWPAPPDYLGGPELAAFETNAHHITGSRFLQLGAYSGAATEWMHERFPDAEIHDVDTWTGAPDDPDQCASSWPDVRGLYDRRCAAITQVISYETTTDGFFATDHGLFDFIYVDGDHKTDQVYRDAVNSYNHLRVGGVISFDDYHHQTGDVPRPAIDRFVSEFDVEIIHDADDCGHTEYGAPRQRWLRKTS